MNFFPSNRAILPWGGAAFIAALAWAVTLPLSSSLWLDELLSAWITSGSFADTIHRAWAYQGQSPMYFALLWAARGLFGDSESALRSLSLASGLLSLGILFILCRRWWGTRPACIAVTALLLVDEFSVAALSARPYSIAILSLLLSLWATETWIEKRRPAWLFCAALFALMTFYGHYLFLLAFILPGSRLWAAHREVPLRLQRSVAAAALILCAGMAPGFYQLWLLREKSSLYAFATSPTWNKLWQYTVPPAVLLAGLFAAIIVAVVQGRAALREQQPDFPEQRNSTARTAPPAAVTLCWWIVPILCFFCLSSASAHSLFLPRLFLWAYLGTAMTLACVTAAFLVPRAQTVVLAVFLLLALQKNVDRRWAMEDWRETARTLSELPDAARGTVLLYSGLIEAHTPGWALDPAHYGYLSAPFAFYPIPQTVEILPWHSGTAARLQQLRPALEKARGNLPLILVMSRKRIGEGGAWSDEQVISTIAEAGLSSRRLTDDKALISIWSVAPETHS